MKKTKHERLVERVRKLYAMAQQTDQSHHGAEAVLRNCIKLMDRPWHYSQRFTDQQIRCV